MNPELRPATREAAIRAFRHLYGDVPPEIPARFVGYTAHLGDKVIGVGGVAIYPNGGRVAFCDVSDEGRAFPLTLHRAARMTIAQAKRMGIKRIVVLDCDDVHPKTPAWLVRLGFKRGLVAEGRRAFILEGF